MSKKTKHLPKVAYFCMEYGLHSDFKIYAGGLGILAGDYLKGAKDYDYPIVGLGIMWKQGYGDQMIDENGQPFDAYRNRKYEFLKDTGVTVDVQIRSVNVKCKVWLVDAFGNAPLYLLDTDLPENADAWISGQLYGWFGEERIAQEMVLGIGGVRALRALGINVDLYHFNEGHALFAGFELLRERMEYKGDSFKKATKKLRQQIVFTTHTPVAQGNETHPIDRIMYMGANLCLKRKHLSELGSLEDKDHFNMTVGALRMSKKSNAVAQLHGKTANIMWADVKKSSKIAAITNGIHVPTWVDGKVLLAAYDLKATALDQLWDAHFNNKKALVDFIEERNGVKLDVNKLIIGFSRRAVPYKRSDLIFRNPEIIEPLLKNQTIQLVFSGKSHPLDDAGKAIVATLVEMSKKYPKSVVFLTDYDMRIGAVLTRGADVWLNNPVRPKEASGTSGMKASMNGVLNLSILDGWWPEACDHGVNGWQFGDAKEYKNPAKQDLHDMNGLHSVLTKDVVPTFYKKKTKWREMMRNSVVSTHKQFSVRRMLGEYYEILYK
ncbi:MAG: alpha-glucan family phosphorylase [Saprospiraceae bacterium]|nr:alpha-glucan family phosphorylase [Saprospiraceae bacterium]MCF8248304.1 alpha-glucan family phosphorylase [Saprospiraceae bacterium]MCF8279942.1 alpha-glucan family phosphorylase [Bacteroidales bacterium]MCF8309832.1 alpha-glucan family phosphorylase [Saprospiraceae bacterium]MCF8438837.1 alpha-glucan family phosphorylase [Saprospiraceae bacterium]